MKLATYLVLLSLAIGCSVNSDLKNNRVRIVMRDSTLQVYKLIAVRDTVLIVRVDHPDSIHTRKLIPIEEIDRVYHASYAPTAWMLAGLPLGCAAGIATGSAVSPPRTGHGGPDMSIGFYGCAGMVVGGLLGWYIPDHETWYDPHDQSDRDDLDNLSIESDILRMRGLK